jgi:ADP-ribose pyrophosphatase YjhB (NUDIX family)
MIKRHKIIPAGYLLLERENEVLFSRRKNTGYRDGEYSLISGHGDAEESLADCIIREAKEEADIVIEKNDLQLVHVISRIGDGDGEERVDLFWKCTKWKGEIKNIEKEKCSDLSWFKKDNLPINIIPLVKIAIENSEAEILYSEYGW